MENGFVQGKTMRMVWMEYLVSNGKYAGDISFL
jgi:hypothetical protein